MFSGAPRKTNLREFTFFHCGTGLYHQRSGAGFHLLGLGRAHLGDYDSP